MTSRRLNDIKSLTKNIQKQKLKSELENSANNAEKIADVDDEVRFGKWSDDENEIDTKVYDVNGNYIPLSVIHEKLRDGKFNIKLSPNYETKPGLYKIVSTLIIDGNEYVVESEFAWGLVSLNTNKSTYHPNETAKFVIVVLDSQGHPVDGAQLDMIITRPDGKTTELSTNHDITAGNETGLYETTFDDTDVEGTYNVQIHAIAHGIDVTFNTTFDVASFYEFDIIRTAQSKIDPTVGPNAFDVIIDIESFVGGDSITIIEEIPAVLDVETDANIITINDRKVLTWTKSLIDAKTSVSYTYSVPFVFPSLYDLGPAKIWLGDNVFVEARPWYVANDPETVWTVPGTATATGSYGNAGVVSAVQTQDGTIMGGSGGNKWQVGETGTFTNFGFDTTVPTGATIDDIQVQTIVSGASGTNNIVYTLTLQGVTGTCSQSLTVSGAGSGAGVNGTATGAPGGTWNTSRCAVSDTQVRSTAFGVEVAPTSVPGSTGFELDYVAIKIVYTEAATAPNPPDPPIAFSDAIGPDVTFTWNPPSSPPSGNYGYSIDRKLNGGTSSNVGTISEQADPAESFTDTGLDNSTANFYKYLVYTTESGTRSDTSLNGTLGFVPDSLAISDAITKSITKNLSDTLAISEDIATSSVKNVLLSDQISISEQLSTIASLASISETLGLDEFITLTTTNPTSSKINITATTTTKEITVTKTNTQIIVTDKSSKLNNVTLTSSFEKVIIDYSDSDGFDNTSDPSAPKVSIDNGFNVNFVADHQDTDGIAEDNGGVIKFADSTTLTGPSGWNGTLVLPSITTKVTIPDQTTTSRCCKEEHIYKHNCFCFLNHKTWRRNYRC